MNANQPAFLGAATPTERALVSYLSAWFSLQEKSFGAVPPMAQMLLSRARFFAAAPLPAGVELLEPKLCYSNASQLALARPEELAYVEGYACTPDGFTTEHAWCVDRVGQVVDPTWPDPQECGYFGIPLREEFLLERLLIGREYGVFSWKYVEDLAGVSMVDMVHPWWLKEIADRGG